MKKKILHLITGLEVGGAEMMLLKTLPHLQDYFDNRVCCIMGHGPIGKQLEKESIPVYYLDLRNPTDLGSLFRFKDVIKKFRPDILSTNLIHADLFGRILGRLFGIKKIVSYQHGQLLQWNFLRHIDRATKSLVTKYIVQTETAKRDLADKLHLPDGKFTVIPNTIIAKEFEFEMDRNEKRHELGLTPDDIIVTCVSNLRRGKGHRYLLEAFESLYHHPDHGKATSIRNKSLHLLIVGDGEMKQNLLSQAVTSVSKDNIHFLGNRTDVKEILQVSDAFILPTLGEGMSIAIMEAMASGLPIITTDLPENRELIDHNRTGILVPPKDARALAQAIRIILDSEQQRKTLGVNARRMILERFDVSIITSKLALFFSNL